MVDIRLFLTKFNRISLDDLAFLFTGSPAPPSAQVVTTTEQEAVEESVDDGPLLNSGLSGTTEQVQQWSDITAQRAHQASSSNNQLTSPGASSSSTSHPSQISRAALLADLNHPLFSLEQLGVDRRLLVNRKRQLKMYRVWMQGKFKKL